MLMMFEQMHEDDLELVAKRFKYARRQAGLSHLELAREAGYKNLTKGRRRVLNIEAAEPPIPDVRVLRRFGYTLNIDICELWDEIDEIQQRRLEQRLKTEPPQVLGSLLGDARKEADLSIADVVKQAGLEPTKYYNRRLRRFEIGDARFPAVPVLHKLCEVLNIDVERAMSAREAEGKFYDRLDGRMWTCFVGGPFDRSRTNYLCSRDFNGPRRTLQAIERAVEIAREEDRQVGVHFPGRRRLNVRADGTFEELWQPPKTYER